MATREVGAYEAKTHLPRLLEDVARGEHITITKHGRPVALLVPVGERRRRPVEEVISDILHFGESHRLGKTSLRELIEEGRR